MTAISTSARLSYDEFEIAIKAFMNQIHSHMPWTLNEYRDPRSFQSTKRYLALNRLQLNNNNAINNNNDNNFTLDQNKLNEFEEEAKQEQEQEQQQLLDNLASMGEDVVQEVDESELLVSKDDVPAKDIISVSYHIVFSPSYQVPVLYFNAFKQDDNSPITLNEIYTSLVPKEWQETVRNSGLSGGISQQDHPIFNIPYYYMHPCETVSLMETVIKANPVRFTTDQETVLQSYIATWLSFTGQAIGLALPIEMVSS
ncbi:hypothetical protein BG004_007066 [Podila humilis]|nr:hypothetical protein BG004_007066 [Podila humilis]